MRFVMEPSRCRVLLPMLSLFAGCATSSVPGSQLDSLLARLPTETCVVAMVEAPITVFVDALFAAVGSDVMEACNDAWSRTGQSDGLSALAARLPLEVQDRFAFLVTEARPSLKPGWAFVCWPRRPGEVPVVANIEKILASYHATFLFQRVERRRFHGGVLTELRQDGAKWPHQIAIVIQPDLIAVGSSAQILEAVCAPPQAQGADFCAHIPGASFVQPRVGDATLWFRRDLLAAAAASELPPGLADAKKTVAGQIEATPLQVSAWAIRWLGW